MDADHDGVETREVRGEADDSGGGRVEAKLSDRPRRSVLGLLSV